MHSIPTLQLKIFQPNFLIRKTNTPSRKDRAAVPSGLDPESSRGYFRLRPVARAFRTETGRQSLKLRSAAICRHGTPDHGRLAAQFSGGGDPRPWGPLLAMNQAGFQKRGFCGRLGAAAWGRPFQ